MTNTNVVLWIAILRNGTTKSFKRYTNACCWLDRMESHNERGFTTKCQYISESLGGSVYEIRHAG